MSYTVQPVKLSEVGKDAAIDPRKLRSRRNKAGLSVSELARLGCSKSFVSMLERGQRECSGTEKVALFARVLECEPADLMLPQPSANGSAA